MKYTHLQKLWSCHFLWDLGLLPLVCSCSAPVMEYWVKILFLVSLCFNLSWVYGVTDPNDLAILQEFKKGLDNGHLLDWPQSGGDPCGRPLWPHVFCSGSRVSQIQVQGLGLSGPLPQSFNQLSMLTNIGLQRNNFTGKLPSFSGLSTLQYAYLGSNQFNTISSDFFVGLTSLQVLSLDRNPLNLSTGWSLPQELQNSVQLTNLSLISCNLIGPLPDFLGGMPSLTVLELSHNSLSGEIPASFSGMSLRILWLNDQLGTGLNGSIDVIASMIMLTDVWLHGNSFSGSIPSAIGACTSLTNLTLNDNQLVGLVPKNLTVLPQLQLLHLDNNKLMGSIPKVRFSDFTYSHNSFCQSTPGIQCMPEVTALLDFLGAVNYPSILAASWLDNDPCTRRWRGISCVDNKVSTIDLSNLGLNGSISPSVGNLDSLVDIKLGGNNLNGMIPDILMNLKSLKILNVSGNNLGPPIPKFSRSVILITDGNPLLQPSGTPVTSPHASSSPLGNSPSPSGNYPHSEKSPHGDDNRGNPSKDSNQSKVLITMVPIVLGVLLVSLVMLCLCCRRKGKPGAFAASTPVLVHPRDPSDPDDMVKIVIANNANNSLMANNLDSGNGNHTNKTHAMEVGNSAISVQILRTATQNFASKNEVGRGGFGVVYKGELHDGAVIAVKRMEVAVMNNKAFDEFQAEIAILSKFRHRNLVSLLGYSVEGSERLLVYEYMPQGALSKHLFHWRQLNLEPLTWKKRLYIALDIARGMQYLHNFAHQCFIHRDLKSSNILLGDDYRAKVSDFGLVKLAPDGKNSVVTRLAGTFGYLAPEYAVTGKITTKADVYSFGVVLMELITGLKALDDNRPEESRYLASWFNDMRSNNMLMDAIDPSLDVTQEIFESISIIAELAGYCAAREPYQRPDMGHAVNVLAPLVEKWKPINDDQEDYLGIDLGKPLLQMVKGWQAADSMDVSSSGLDDSKGSIPARPAGFADSFTSADGR